MPSRLPLSKHLAAHIRETVSAINAAHAQLNIKFQQHQRTVRALALDAGLDPTEFENHEVVEDTDGSVFLESRSSNQAKE